MPRKYAGWVPTVLGRLSFNLIGREGFPFPFEIERLKINGYEIYFIFQKRIPPDMNIIPFISKFIPIKLRLLLDSIIANYKKEPYIENFFSIIKVKEYKNGHPIILHGYVFKFERVNNIGNIINEIKDNLNMLCSKGDVEALFSNDFMDGNKNTLKSKIYELFQQKYKNIKAFSISYFELKRNGIIIFECDDKTQKRDCNNFYRFIKDVFHVHKHHHYLEDSLIEVSEVDLQTNLHNINIEKDIKWTDDIFRNMLRYVVRNRSYYGYNIIGVLEYVKSFKHVLEKEIESNTNKNKNGNNNENNNNDDNKNKSEDFNDKIYKNIFKELDQGIDSLKESILYQMKCEDRKFTAKRWLLGITLGIVYAYIRVTNKNYLFLADMIYAYILVQSIAVINGVKSFSYYLKDDLSFVGGIVNTIKTKYIRNMTDSQIANMYIILILLFGVIFIALGYMIAKLL